MRGGWFRSFMRGEDHTISPQQVVDRMLRVGWQRRGVQGRIKASCPNRPQQLAWAFFIVAPDWEAKVTPSYAETELR